MAFDLFKKKGRKFGKKLRAALHLTSKNKLGRSLKHFQSMFGGNNSATSVKLQNGAYYSGSGYQYHGRTLSQMTGGY